ncbi:MAG: formylglycine-generating enzyme family protein [Planctomycetes bacterium]|nr:formylglycine-generating enzyme family protein [Planctomycetota bacterium]
MKHVTSAALAFATLTSLAGAQNPQPYCSAGITSNLCTAQLSANRQPNVANSAACVITVGGVPGNRQGLVFYGIDNSGFTPSVWAGGLSSSYLCVKAPIQRLGATQNSGGALGQCNGSYVINWDAFQNANPTALGNPWNPGDSVFAQSWYRDPSAPGASNLSNALELTLTPPFPIPCVSSAPGMAAIPSGTFIMGSDLPYPFPYGNGSIPTHAVTISYCFWMGVTEVTQAQYSALMATNPSTYVAPDHPVERVSVFEAAQYCANLTTQHSALGLLPPGYQYRLPTEAEWEYACRAGTTTEYNVGPELTCADACFDIPLPSGGSFCNGPTTEPVATFPPNAWGLYDMHGNVSEWCLDVYWPYVPGAVTDPYTPLPLNPQYQVHRGGSRAEDSPSCRSDYRNYGSALNANIGIGFRVVLAPILVP